MKFNMKSILFTINVTFAPSCRSMTVSYDNKKKRSSRGTFPNDAKLYKNHDIRSRCPDFFAARPLCKSPDFWNGKWEMGSVGNEFGQFIGA
ncbi:hypothetical protein HMPREF9135_0194 [Segatella baroniae F0067]|uniref:Uncharacterized protein n=1 Tax=Segatella baroniae F0067 TaxID=1115809 RepID=U2QEW4_9BACT|nr:hypothetical protein HMPREF9135_0194 [Segatella baroniae F0067]